VDKAPDAFRTISEVAEQLDVPQHVLRFWESRFREIRPMKRGGGRRYYRPDDLDLLRGIRHLLYGEGYTIRGVQRLLREQGVRFVQNVWQPGAPQPTRQATEEDDTVEETEAAEGAGALRLPLLRGVIGSERPQRSEDERVAAARATAPVAGGLAREDVQKLQTALHDLTECRRLLDAALAEKI
jgi:DNA-binding transcriptional MerR regulator